MSLARAASAVHNPPTTEAAGASTDGNEVLVRLMYRCAHQDEAALASLYELTSPWMYALVSRQTNCGELGDDAMVAMYSKVWRRAARYVEHDQSVLAWMISLAFETD